MCWGLWVWLSISQSIIKSETRGTLIMRWPGWGGRREQKSGCDRYSGGEEERRYSKRRTAHIDICRHSSSRVLGKWKVLSQLESQVRRGDRMIRGRPWRSCLPSFGWDFSKCNVHRNHPKTQIWDVWGRGGESASLSSQALPGAADSETTL